MSFLLIQKSKLAVLEEKTYLQVTGLLEDAARSAERLPGEERQRARRSAAGRSFPASPRSRLWRTSRGRLSGQNGAGRPDLQHHPKTRYR